MKNELLRVFGRSLVRIEQESVVEATQRHIKEFDDLEPKLQKAREVFNEFPPFGKEWRSQFPTLAEFQWLHEKGVRSQVRAVVFNRVKIPLFSVRTQ